MEPINLLAYLLIFLVVAIADAMVYTRLKEWKMKRERGLELELAEIEASYSNLIKDVREAQSNENRLKAELLELKKTAAREKSSDNKEKKTRPGDKPLSVMDVLKKNGVITQDMEEKARNYLERSDNSGLKLEDGLVLLGLITSDQLKKARHEAGVLK